MLRRLKNPKEAKKPFLNSKECYLLLWVNKQFGQVISKDVVKWICKKFLLCSCYTEYYFHCKYQCWWDRTERNVFSSILSKRVNELECTNSIDADRFIVALSCSLIASNYSVRIVCFENERMFSNTKEITSEMGLDISSTKEQMILQKSMSLKNSSKWKKVYYARKNEESRPLLWWHTIKNYNDRINSRMDYLIFYGCEILENKKQFCALQTNPCHGMLCVSIKEK